MGSTLSSESLWRGECVICPLAARNSPEALQELTARLASVPGVRDITELRQAIEARERESPTYLDAGIALPHARTDAVDRLVLAAGTTPAGLAWPAPPAIAHLVFVVGVPRRLVRDYLELLRRITRAARQPGWVQKAVTCSNAAELTGWLRGGIGG